MVTGVIKDIDIDRRADKPAYKQLADHIRGLIERGALGPGAALPPESAFVISSGLNRTTVRNAIKILRTEGLVDVVQGRGTFVRQHRLIRQHLVDGLRTGHNLVGQLPTSPRNDLWPATTGIAAQVEVRCDYRRVSATRDVAEALGAADAAPLPVLRRRYLFLVDDRPHQVSWSYLRWDLVDGTPAADPANERIHRGTMARLADIGVPVTSATIAARTRMPSQDEVRLLDIGDGTPVFALRRILFAGAAPVEVNDTTAPGDRLELVLTVDFSGPP